MLPLAMRMGEALWHAIIRKNYGCTHLIAGRDHAGPGTMKDYTPFYRAYAVQERLQVHTKELEMEVVPFRLMVCVPALYGYPKTLRLRVLQEARANRIKKSYT